MYTVVKKNLLVQACRLGEDSPLYQRLVEEGKIVPVSDGVYQVLSLETDGQHGEIACDGDFVKVDPKGCAYPNEADIFLENHVKIGENLYMEKTQRRPAWDVQEPMCDEIAFLMEQKGLVIDRQSTDRYFSAPLCGTTLYAARDAVIVFYSITRGENGLITDAIFNFVNREVFIESYERLG